MGSPRQNHSNTRKRNAMGKMEKLWNDCASTTTFHGPAHVLETTHCSIKLFWVLVFLVSAGYCSWQAWFLIQEFRAENVLTSISAIDNLDKPEFATLLYCPEDWISYRKAALFTNEINFDDIYDRLHYSRMLHGLDMFDYDNRDSLYQTEFNQYTTFMAQTGCKSLECAFLKISKDVDFPTEQSNKIFTMGGVCHSIKVKVSPSHIAVFTFLHTEIEKDEFPAYQLSLNHFNREYPTKSVKGSHVHVPAKISHNLPTMNLQATLRNQETTLALDKLERSIGEMETIQAINKYHNNSCWFPMLHSEIQPYFDILRMRYEQGGIRGFLLNDQLDETNRLKKLSVEAESKIETYIYIVRSLSEIDDISATLTHWIGNITADKQICNNSEDLFHWDSAGINANCCDKIDLNTFWSKSNPSKFHVSSNAGQLGCIRNYIGQMKADSAEIWMDILMFIFQRLSHLNTYDDDETLVMRGTDADSFSIQLEEFERVDAKSSHCQTYSDLLSTSIHIELCDQGCVTTKQLHRQCLLTYNDWSNPNISVCEQNDGEGQMCVNKILFCPEPIKSCHEITFNMIQVANHLQRHDVTRHVKNLLENVNDTTWTSVSPIPMVGYSEQDMRLDHWANWVSPEDYSVISIDTDAMELPSNFPYNAKCNNVLLSQSLATKSQQEKIKYVQTNLKYEYNIALTENVTHQHLNKESFEFEMGLYNTFKNQYRGGIGPNICETGKPCWFMRHVTIEFQHAVRYTERFEYSTMFVLGHVGGLFGLFIGASLMSFVHIVVICLTSLSCGTGACEAQCLQREQT